MPTNQHTTGFTIKVNGAELSPEAVAKIKEWRVDDHLKLPDTFVITVFETDPDHMTLIDDKGLFAVGAEVEISASAVPLGGSGSAPPTMTSLIKGLITSIEPEFSAEMGAIMTVRGYDRSHTMTQEKKAVTYQDVTIGDIASKVASGAGLSPSVGSVGTTALKFVQQNNESDWEFLGRMAQRVGARVMVEGGRLKFVPAAESAEGPLLEWGKNLLSFRPRITGVQQASEVLVRGWDAKSKRAIEATVKAPSAGELMAEIGEERSSIVKAMKGARHTIADRPVTSPAEAQELAKSVMGKIANSFLEAQGICLGDPGIKAGGRVTVKGVGKRFSGKFVLSSTRHVYRAGGYRTHFQISGEQERSLVDLLTPARTKRWGNSVVLGIVTNNEDQDGMGRVRVKYPALGDTEGNWARVCQPAVGKGKGLMWIPAVGDEVVIGFEHDDVNHPYVLGSVFNGTDKPSDGFAKQALGLVNGGDDKALAKEGSASLLSPKHIGIETKEKMGLWVGEELQIKVGDCTVTCKKDGTIEIKGKNITFDASQNVEIKATQNLSLKAQQGATLDGGGTLTVKATGTVSVSGSQVSLG